ncbi:MAG: manganese efflux pump MntP family protein [Mangrovicoccus sp.]
MSPLSIGVIAVSLSLDAFIVALGKGAAAREPSLSFSLRTGLIFGITEALSPLIGWAAGLAASQYIAAVDHWIAFALLSGVGLRMIILAWEGNTEAVRKMSFWALLIAAIGTSVDAMAVGVSLAFLNVNILVTALVIGATTMIMSSTGMFLGRLVGARFGRYAEALGGLALLILGSSILWEHLSAPL